MKWARPTQSAFFAELTRVAPRLTYDDLARWCEAHGRPRPSGMGDEQRALMLAWLRDEEHAFRVLEWAAIHPAVGAKP